MPTSPSDVRERLRAIEAERAAIAAELADDDSIEVELVADEKTEVQIDPESYGTCGHDADEAQNHCDGPDEGDEPGDTFEHDDGLTEDERALLLLDEEPFHDDSAIVVANAGSRSVAREADWQPSAQTLRLAIPTGWSVKSNVLIKPGGGSAGWVLWIVGVVELDNGEQHLVVRWNNAQGSGRAIITARVTSDSRALTELATRGFPIAEAARKDYSAWLHKLWWLNRSRLPTERRTGRLGWHGNTFVWPDEVVYPRDYKGRRIQFEPRDLEAARIATAITTRRGSLDRWIAAVAPAYQRFPNFAATLCVAFSSVLLEPLGITEGLVGDVNDETQVGKTSELRVCATAFGEASGDDRLVTTWGSTKTGLEFRAGTLGSLPLFLDESRERRRNASVTPTVYMLTNGHGDDRGKPGGAADKVSWKLTTVSTGEASLIDYVAEAGGAVGRILPLPGMPFGEKSPDRAKLITRLVQESNANCGNAGREFVRRLIAGEFGTPTALRAEYDRRVATFLGLGYETRLAEHVALIAVTADLLRRAFGLRPPTFTTLWMTAKDASGKPGDEQAALEALVSIVAANRNLIVDLEDRDDDDRPRRAWGEELGVFRDGKLALHPDKTRRLLEDRDRRFDFHAAVRAWQRAGLLDRDGRTKNIGVKVACGPLRPRMLRFTEEATASVFGIGEPDDEQASA